MRKMRLDLEALDVETFVANDDAQEERGTVKAHAKASLEWSTCETWERTCGGTEFGQETCDILASCDTNCAWGTTCFGGLGTC